MANRAMCQRRNGRGDRFALGDCVERLVFMSDVDLIILGNKTRSLARGIFMHVKFLCA